MNSVVIILGILIVFLIYLLVLYLTSKAYVLGSQYDFTQVIQPISGDKLPAATNVSYAYGIWLYVQNWDPAIEKTILYRKDNIKLYLDSKNPALYCDISMTNNTKSKKVMITTNFPLQKWVCILLSVDGQFLDCYLDGKLVISYQIVVADNTGTITANPAQPPDSNVAPLYLGNSATPGFRPSTSTGSPGSGWSATANSVTRWTAPVDPQSAWNWYMKGNGSRVGNYFTTYGVNYTILKDNVAIVNNKPLF